MAGYAPILIKIALLISILLMLSLVNIPHITKVKKISLCNKIDVLIPEVLLLPTNMSIAGMIIINIATPIAYLIVLRFFIFWFLFLETYKQKAQQQQSMYLVPQRELVALTSLYMRLISGKERIGLFHRPPATLRFFRLIVCS